MRTLQARRTTYRSEKSTEKFVRITGEGCVLDNDMHMLKHSSNPKYKVLVVNEVKEKTLAQLELDGELYLADVITGTLYRKANGVCCSSSHMTIQEQIK